MTRRRSAASSCSTWFRCCSRSRPSSGSSCCSRWWRRCRSSCRCSGWARTVDVLIWAGRWPVIFVLIILALAVLYRFGPSRPDVRWRWITPGSILAAVGLVVFSMLFSWYAANIGKFNETYGSLGAVIGFMTWMWLSATIVLVGAELNAEIEKGEAPKRLSRPVALEDVAAPTCDMSIMAARRRTPLRAPAAGHRSRHARHDLPGVSRSHHRVPQAQAPTSRGVAQVVCSRSGGLGAATRHQRSAPQYAPRCPLPSECSVT